MSSHEPETRITEFFKRLEGLDSGGRARLKRCAGVSLSEARHESIGLFYKLLPPGIPIGQEEVYFLAASLFPIAKSGGKGNLGKSLRQARNEKNAKGLDRRVEHLLDADEMQLSYRLRRAIAFLQSNRVPVDWPLLLQDLLFWNASGRLVQRRWARAYFGE